MKRMTKENNSDTHDWQEYNGDEFHRIKGRDNDYFSNNIENMHTYVWETFMETDIPNGCVIHHVDLDKSNNDISNLVCMTKEEHFRWHTKNRPSNRKGCKHSEESKLKMSKAQKGRIPWNKGKTGVYSPDKIKQWSEAHKNISEETRKKMSESAKKRPPGNKGKKQQVVTCPHCGKIGGIQNMNRYHFNNCKNRRQYGQ
ncbi:MAG: hypothetical protein B6229_00395 [Spirochaetaceae bacterium 4572_7]|nr:MAG: hypothetical protein B6229_00395 [Spirochaetaceae bacterium 4572_7]